MDFAPVLDINSNPKNPVIGDRSFGTSSKLVSSLGVETMMGIQEGKVIPVVKHFPRHGDTSVDSHVGLPRVNKDLEQLNSFELIPFMEAIKNNVDGIMIAHILLPKIDSKYPASLSKVVIDNILRQKLGFKGIVITDDMTMGAIAKNYSIGDAAVRSVDAGSDIILVAHDYNKGIEAITSIINAVNIGNIKMDRIDESVYRILQLKERYNLEDMTIGSVNINEINSKINETLTNYIK
jgi:beta-N-acetylhexosaminidase